MTLKQRIRKITDALAPGEWLTLEDFRARLPDFGYFHVASTIGRMCRSEQLKRRGARKAYAYRSGPRPVVEKARGRPARSTHRLGFMALARLERDDPAAYRKAVAADRRRA